MFPITVVGSYPKPQGLKIPSWFDSNYHASTDAAPDSVSQYNKYLSSPNKKQLDQKLWNAFKQVLDEQVKLGVDIPTDGELNRENYVFHHCRHIHGFDFEVTEEKEIRNNPENKMIVPKLQKITAAPLKITIPGPMTIVDTVFNEFYKDNEDDLLWDLSCAINTEILKLAKCGLRYVQIDEPVWARYVGKANRIGFRCLERCFKDVGKSVHRTVHICCGYTNSLDETTYKKAPNNSYVELAKAGLDDLPFLDAVSVEDAYKKIPLEFFSKMKKLDIMLGCVTSVTSEVTTVAKIVERVSEVVEKGGVDPSRILLSPDCGLAMLPVLKVKGKLSVLNEARKILREKYSTLEAVPEGK